MKVTDDSFFERLKDLKTEILAIVCQSPSRQVSRSKNDPSFEESKELKMECQICYETVQCSYECMDDRCTISICDDCFEQLINVCYENKSGLFCPSPNCKKLILRKTVPYNSLEKYDQILYDSIMNKHKDSVIKKEQYDILIQKLRNEKQAFMDTMPLAIKTVARICMDKKVKSITKIQQTKNKEITEKSNHKCMNLTCSGMLNSQFICMTCDTTFCKECHEVNSDNHKCKEEIIESLKFIQTMIHCPGCKLPVEKKDGCNNITCSSCGTKFSYETGLKGGGGSANKKIDLRQNYKLSSIYNNNQNITERLLILESEAPKDKQLDLVKLLQVSNTKKNSNEYFSKKYNEYIIHKNEHKKYQKKLIKIESMLKNETDDLIEKLDQLIITN